MEKQYYPYSKVIEIAQFLETLPEFERAVMWERFEKDNPGAQDKYTKSFEHYVSSVGSSGGSTIEEDEARTFEFTTATIDSTQKLKIKAEAELDSLKETQNYKDFHHPAVEDNRFQIPLPRGNVAHIRPNFNYTDLEAFADLDESYKQAEKEYHEVKRDTNPWEYWLVDRNPFATTAGATGRGASSPPLNKFVTAPFLGSALGDEETDLAVAEKQDQLVNERRRVLSEYREFDKRVSENYPDIIDAGMKERKLNYDLNKLNAQLKFMGKE